MLKKRSAIGWGVNFEKRVQRAGGGKWISTMYGGPLSTLLVTILGALGVFNYRLR